MPKKLLLLIAIAVMLAACLPSQQSTEVQSQVNTAVAGTMDVNEQIAHSVELTVAAKESNNSVIEAPAGVDSNNVVLQATPTLVVTDTPFILPTVTPTTTKIPLKYSCSAITKKPRTNQPMHGGEEFDIKWTITNTGTGTWYDALDIKYYSGESFANSKRAEIHAPLAPGQSYDIVLDATAPKAKGQHFMAWYVEDNLCYAYVTIWVE